MYLSRPIIFLDNPGKRILELSGNLGSLINRWGERASSSHYPPDPG